MEDYTFHVVSIVSVHDDHDYDKSSCTSDYLTAVGIEYPVPEDPSLVRGWNYPSGILCYPLEG